ncbi:SS18 family [Phytophthora cactorum]|nr:SS18 family [Phytophthora cactorum]
MPNSSSSDAETVLGEDSPLSPCVWIHSATVEEWRQSPVQETAEISSEACSAQASEPRQGETDFRLQNTRRELQLSPASQLNVLSQISELADAQSRQQEARPEALQPNKPTQRTHMWAPVVETAKRKKNARTAASTTRPKAKKQKTTQKKPSHSQAERLAADMVDWETCSEGGLFTVDSSEEDQWVYDDIIDNDFEASGLRWTASPAAAADDEDSGSASSISDVFADVRFFLCVLYCVFRRSYIAVCADANVNEDLIVATAESQAEGDVDGLIAYQRILHRDLMEMAEFIDSMFGVYSNTNSNNTSLTPISTVLIPPVTCCMSEKKSDESELPVVVDLTTEAADGQEPAPTVEKTTAVKKKAAKKKAQRGALLTAIEAGEKVRETQRQRSNGSSRDIRCSKRKASVPS